MLTNGVQQTEEFNDFKSSHFSAVITPVKAVSWTVNYYLGPGTGRRGQARGPQRLLPRVRHLRGLDVVAGRSSAPTCNHTTNQVNAGDATTALTGLAVYARVKPSAPSTLALALRAPGRPGPLRRRRAGAAGGHGHGGVEVRRGLPAARRVPPRLVERRVLHRARRLRATCAPTSPPASSGSCGGSATRQERGERHADLVFVVATVAFFALAVAYVRGCQRCVAVRRT